MTATVSVVLRTRTPGEPTLTTQGTVPDANCPLAVTLAHIFDHDSSRWRLHSLGGYYITHRSTGWQLGSVRFATIPEALAVIARLDVTNPCWTAANGGDRDPATLACKAKWRAAVPGWRY